MGMQEIYFNVMLPRSPRYLGYPQNEKDISKIFDKKKILTDSIRD